MNTFTKIFALLLIGTGLTSCLKDDNVDNQKYGMINLNANKIVGTSSTSASFALPFEDVNRDVTVLTLKLDAESPATEDLVVTLSLAQSDAMIAAYNTANATTVVALPSNLYTLPSGGLAVTIPKGSRSVPFVIKINTSKINPSLTYGLGLTLASIDKAGYTISGNFGKSLVRISAKNKYDGVYTMKTKMTASDRPTVNTTTQWTWPGDVHLVTTSGTSVNLYDDYGFKTYIHPIQTSTGGLSGFGETNPRFTLDLATNKVTKVENSTIAGNGRTFVIDPTGTNQYTPSNKTLTATYFMNQPGFQPLKIETTFTYKKVRP